MFNFMRLPPLRRLMLMKAITGGGSWSTISGNPVSFTAKAAPLRKLEVAFSPVQSLNGYDAPWPAGGGKNVLDFKAALDFWGATYTENADGSFTVTNIGYGYTRQYQFASEDATYTMSAVSLINGSSASGWGVDFVSASGSGTGVIREGSLVAAGKTACKIRLNYSQPGDGFTIKNIQIEAGSTATAWTPYSNICPISGWDSLNVEQRGKNLYPYETIPAYTYLWYAGSKALADATQPILLKGGASYVLSYALEAEETTAPTLIRAWKADGTILDNEKTVLNARVLGETDFYLFNWQATPQYYQAPRNGGNNATLIEPTEDLWVDIRISGNNGAGSSPMLVVGTDKADYVPYTGRSISISLGSTVYSGYVDVISGVGEIDWATVTFDGSEDENWARHQSGSAAAFAMAISISGANIIDPKNSIKANYLKTLGVGDTWGNYDNWVSANGVDRMVTGIRSITTIEAWKTYLSENPLEVVYELATPIPIQLTPQEVQSLAGDNTMWTDAASLEVTYRSN